MERNLRGCWQVCIGGANREWDLATGLLLPAMHLAGFLE